MTIESKRACLASTRPSSRVRTGLAVAAAVTALGAAYAPAALAANPTFAIVEPSEWDLPIVPSANVFIQTGIAQTNGSVYDGAGKSQDTQGSHLYAGVTRFAHLFSFKSLPKVGFFWEILQPEIDLEQPSSLGGSVTGLGDPLFDIAAYVKPTPNSTVGIQNLLSVPVGSNTLSNHFWEYLPDLIGDYNIGKFGFDGTLGAGIASSKHSNGADTDIGNTYYAEFTTLYHATNWVAPFLAFNYQVNEPSHDAATGAQAPGAAPVFSCANAGGCHEDVLGGGVKINFTPTRWLSVWYDSGISGQNTVQTNAVYFRFVNIF